MLNTRERRSAKVPPKCSCLVSHAKRLFTMRPPITVSYTLPILPDACLPGAKLPSSTEKVVCCRSDRDQRRNNAAMSQSLISIGKANNRKQTGDWETHLAPLALNGRPGAASSFSEVDGAVEESPS